MTAINPTLLEKKTTTTVGLGMPYALEKQLLFLGFFSLFWSERGAAGGGYAHVVPMEDKLHLLEIYML